MRIIFLSNYYNHHQAKLCKAFYQLIGDGFVFVETEPMEQERVALGWGESEIPDYVWSTHNEPQLARKVQELVDTADVVIYGHAPLEMIERRLVQKKLTFWYCERINKSADVPWYKQLWRRVLYWWKFGRFSEFYLLCAGAYTACDFARTSTFLNKAYKWGYFPETKQYEVEELLKNKTPHSILWVARMIEWKHPEKAVMVAQRLMQEGIEFHLTMVGGGELESHIRQMIQSNGLQERVTLTGSIPAGEVRSYMERAEVFLFTSDRNEGWGAVLNEAMNSGCAVVASHSIGAAPYLGKHEKNCLLYRDSNFEDLYQKARSLLKNDDYRMALGRNAYATISQMWNAETAAQKFVKVCEKLLKKEAYYEQEGPCSKAELLRDDWF